MHKVLSTFFIAIFFGLLGCFKLNEGGESECFPYIRINFMSTSDIDSVQFYLNGEQVCIEQAILDRYKCLNCEKGMLLYDVICRTSAADSFFSTLAVDESCILSDDFPIWKTYECFIDEKEKNDIDSSQLNIQVYSKKGMISIESNNSIRTGFHYNVISEQDTVHWYSYTKVSMRAYFDYYGPSESWKRIECFDGYCVASKPMARKEVCYDK